MTASPSPSTPTRTAQRALLVLGLTAVALGLYQWVELVQLHRDNIAPLCAVSESLDCGAVWDSPLADAVHRYTRLPFAAWGVVWGLVVVALTLVAMARPQRLSAGSAIAALRLTTAVGGLVALGLFAYSITLSTFCLTCIAFYVIVAGAAYIAFAVLRADHAAWPRALALSVGISAAATVALLYPAINTPHKATVTAVPAGTHTETVDTTAALEEFFDQLPPEALKALSNSLAAHQRAQTVDVPLDPRRIIHGTPGGTVRVIEWVDIQCPHCRRLHENMAVVRERVAVLSPPPNWSEEVRFFPLDSECNPHAQRTSGNGVSCLAARATICLSGTPLADPLLDAMFNQQSRLTRERIWEIARNAGADETTLRECVNSRDTEDTLQRDIAYAMEHELDGTPLVAINGRKAHAYPAMIYMLILVQGRPNEPALHKLPPPMPMRGHS